VSELKGCPEHRTWEAKNIYYLTLYHEFPNPYFRAWHGFLESGKAVHGEHLGFTNQS